MSGGFLVGREEREVLRVSLADGRMLTGGFMIIGKQSFIVCRGPALPLQGLAVGPLEEADIVALEVVRSRVEVLEDGRRRLLGDRVPGREPVTRDDHEQRLRTIARAVAGADQSSDGWQREVQLRRQFDDAAARVRLSAAKRQWVLYEERWRLRSNVEPTMADLWVGSTASPSCLARPRPQDFDPDPVVRRKRTPSPAVARADPLGISNMLAALKARGLPARIARLGDPPHLRGEILVKMPINGRAQFAAIAERRDEDLPIQWRLVWDGNDSKAGQRRHRAAVRTADYATLVEVLAHGRHHVQQELPV